MTKKLSNLTNRVIPRYIREDNENFVTFIKSFFEYLEKPLGEYDSAANLQNYRSIEQTVDEFLPQFKFELGTDIPEEMESDLRYILKSIVEFYKIKGTEASIKFLYRTILNKEAVLYYPKVDMLRTSDATTLIGSAKITDSDFYQDYSYEIGTNAQSTTYFDNMVKDLIHPAGLKAFSKQI